MLKVKAMISDRNVTDGQTDGQTTCHGNTVPPGTVWDRASLTGSSMMLNTKHAAGCPHLQGIFN